MNLRRMKFHSRSEEHTSELQSHSFISYAVFCLKKKQAQQIFGQGAHHTSALVSQHLSPHRAPHRRPRGRHCAEVRAAGSAAPGLFFFLKEAAPPDPSPFPPPAPFPT